jgi:hypothetical protein
MYDRRKELRKQNRKGARAFFILITVFFFTLDYGTLESPLDYTLSNIGNLFSDDYWVYFLIWGVITGFGMNKYIKYLYRRTGLVDRKTNRYRKLAVLFLELTVLCPAMKEKYPVLFVVHVICSFLSPVFFALSLYKLVQYLYPEPPKTVKKKRELSKVWILFLITLAIPPFTMITMGPNGLVEILFVFTTGIYMMYLNYKIKKRENQMDLSNVL